MENHSFFIAFLLILTNIYSIIFYKKFENKNKKNLSHYEAIADNHVKKMYNPVSACFHNILILIVACPFLSPKILLIFYFFLILIQNIQGRLALLQSSIDILQLKNGLISMPPVDYNAYFNSWDADIIPEKCIGYDGSESKEKLWLNYKYADKIVLRYTINIEGLTKEQIDDTIKWYKSRFKDYLRYIPQNTLPSDMDNWFAYLDDVRANY